MFALLTQRLVPNCRKSLRRVAAKFNNLRNTQLMKSALGFCQLRPVNGATGLIALFIH
jgi:hypothetical protein